MKPYATDSVSLGSAEEPYDSDMTQSVGYYVSNLSQWVTNGFPMNVIAPAPISISESSMHLSLPFLEGMTLHQNIRKSHREQ